MSNDGKERLKLLWNERNAFPAVQEVDNVLAARLFIIATWRCCWVPQCGAGMASTAKGARVATAAMRHRTARVVKVIADRAAS